MSASGAPQITSPAANGRASRRTPTSPRPSRPPADPGAEGRVQQADAGVVGVEQSERRHDEQHVEDPAPNAWDANRPITSLGPGATASARPGEHVGHGPVPGGRR